MKKKIKCIDIEIAILKEFDYRRNLIVPNVSNMMGLVPFETDMLIINNNNYATGFEIKVSKSDLKADFKKPQHTKINEFKNGKTGMERWWGKFKYFNYAVPIGLEETALELIPDFCGLWTLERKNYTDLRISPNPVWYDVFKNVRGPVRLFNHKWSDKHKYEVARLGTMRILALKEGIRNYQNNPLKIE